MSEPLPPSYIKLVRQNGFNTDCCVATLAVLFSMNYEEALAACVVSQPGVLDIGMTWTEIRRVADALGGVVKLIRRGFYDLDEATGILNVKNGQEDHVVFLWAGRIIEGNGEMWLDAEEYLRHYNYKPYSLLVRTE